MDKASKGKDIKTKKQVKIKTRMNLCVKAAIITVICFCLISIINLQFEYNVLKTAKKDIQNQIKTYQGNIEELKNELSQPYDDEYVKKVAREKLNYRMPDEIIFYNDLLK